MLLQGECFRVPSLTLSTHRSLIFVETQQKSNKNVAIICRASRTAIGVLRERRARKALPPFTRSLGSPAGRLPGRGSRCTAPEVAYDPCDRVSRKPDLATLLKRKESYIIAHPIGRTVNNFMSTFILKTVLICTMNPVSPSEQASQVSAHVSDAVPSGRLGDHPATWRKNVSKEYEPGLR